MKITPGPRSLKKSDYSDGRGSSLTRAWCWVFHRRFWDYITWGGEGFHHMNHCDRCGEDWPERPNVPNIPNVPPIPERESR